MYVYNEIGAFKLQLLSLYKLFAQYFSCLFSRTLLTQINGIFTFAHDLCTL